MTTIDDTNGNAGGEAIRVIKFDGSEDAWRQWSIKTKAIGEMKGWWSEVVAEDDLDIKSTESSLKNRIKSNHQAYHYFLLACTGDAFEYLLGSGGSAKKAWKILEDRYESSETMDLIELLEKFSSSRLKSINQNPDLWIQELEYLRKRIENAGGSRKDDMELISHVIIHSPPEYQVPVEVLSAGRAHLTLDQVKKNLHNYWKRYFKDSGTGVLKPAGANEALIAENNKKKPWKKFKGLCSKCGRQGHKAANCYAKSKVKSEPKDNKHKDLTKIKCYKCNKMGHFAKDCPKKNPDTGMFVGMATLKVKQEPIEDPVEWSINVLQLKFEDKVRMILKGNVSMLCKELKELHSNEKHFDLEGAEADHLFDMMSECMRKRPKFMSNSVNVNMYSCGLGETSWAMMADAAGKDDEERGQKRSAEDKGQEKPIKRDRARRVILRPIPPPRYLIGREPPTSWIVKVEDNDPGHPSQVAKQPYSRDKFKMENRPLWGWIDKVLYVTSGQAPVDVSVKTWKNAQKVVGFKPTSQPDRRPVPYEPHPDEANIFYCDGCQFISDDPEMRNGQLCPMCDDWRNRLWLEGQDYLAHSDVYPDSDSEDYDSDDPVAWMIRKRPEANVAESNKSRSSFFEYPEAWLLDSGASVHITNDKSLMHNLKPTNNEVTIGDGSSVEARWVGDVYLRINSGHVFKLHNVLYIPGFSKNILSLARLLERTCWIKGDNHIMALYQGSLKILMVKDEDSGMFYLHSKRLKMPPEECAMAHVIPPDDDEDLTHSAEEDPVPDREDSKGLKKLDINEAHEKMGHSCAAVLKSTCKQMGIQLVGSLKACEACMKAKARAKPVKKTTDKKATRVGERVFLDTSGPFAPSIRGSKYWGKICDQFSGKTWDRFLTNKSLIPDMVEEILTSLKASNHPVQFLRCDNAGEHQDKLQKICAKFGVTLEYTAPHTPQHNGVVERRFVTDRNRAMAMMLAARLTPAAQNLLRCEAISTASKIGDSVVRQGQTKSAYEIFYGKPSPILPHLVQFGRIGYVTDRTAIKKKWTSKSHKCIMVGYASDHSADTYRMFNPTTRSLILTRDVKWAEWTSPDPVDDLTKYFDKRPGVDTPTLPTPSSFPRSGTPSSDDESVVFGPPKFSIGEDVSDEPAVTIEQLEDSESEEAETVLPPQTRQAAVRTPRFEVKQRIKEKLQTRRYPTRSYLKTHIGGEKVLEVEEAELPETTNIPEVTPAIVEEEENTNQVEAVCNTAIVSDPGEPKNVNQAFSKGWHDPMASEVMNFINRDAWTKTEKSLVTKLGRKPIGTKWVYKVKNLHDGTTKRKARCVVQGFRQIPGVDFTESFSPVATDTAIRLLIVIFLHMKKFAKKTKWVLEMFDVEAAFLNAEIDQRMFIEFPQGMEELGFIEPGERDKYCIELNRTMYGDIAAPLRWMRTITKTLVEDMGMIQSEVDPCIFYKKDQNGKLTLLCAVFVDDTLVTGLDREVKRFYEEFQRHYNIEILGKLSKHLGVNWTW